MAMSAAGAMASEKAKFDQSATPVFRAAIADDDASIRQTVAMMLEREGYIVDVYEDGQAALDGMTAVQPDIAIVDLVMPRLDGMELLRCIRENWHFPIIMLTGRDDEIDEALGLRLGADDYMHKPFAQRLLLERLRANLRRANLVPPGPQAEEPVQTKPAQLVRGPLCMDVECHTVTWKGQEVMLTVTEFQLLEALANRPGVVKSRDQLMDIAYDDNVYVDDRTIDSHIKRLRKKLRNVDAEFSAIETLYGVGYRYSPQRGQSVD